MICRARPNNRARTWWHLALENNTGLQLAQSDVRAREFRLQGEKRGWISNVAAGGNI